MTVTRQVGVIAGDVVEISGRRVGDPGRLGEIVEVLGMADHPHYLVRWEDEHESILYPGEGTTIRTGPRHRRRREPNDDLATATVEQEHVVLEAGAHDQAGPGTEEGGR